MRSRFAQFSWTWGLAATFCSAGLTTSAEAAKLEALVGFGGVDGWRAPFEVLSGDAAGSDSGGFYRFLGDAVTNLSVSPGNNDRGLAYNPETGNLILVSRAAGTATGTDRIRILDGVTGVDKGSLNQTGVTGGTFLTNMVGVADDGAIYIGNLSTNLTTSAFKIYRWEDETVAPTVAFSGGGAGGTPILAGARLGDSLDVIGAGADTRLVAGYGSSTTVADTSGFALFDTDNGVDFTATHVSISAGPEFDPVPSGEFRYGVTFVDSDTVLGKSNLSDATMVDVVGGAGTVTAQITTDGSILRPMDFAVVNGKSLAAILEASDGQTENNKARLFVYDITDPLAPIRIAQASALSGIQNKNTNAAGQVKFGAINGNVATIYAMSTNNGIQAFTLTLDPIVEPVDDADFNGDGVVDGADFLTWQAGFGLSGQTDKSTGDADGDGNVNDADLAIWNTQFGTTTTPPAAVSSVPEPATLALAAMGLAGLAAWRRKK